MPRDGSGIYSIPLGTDGIVDQTIESTKYNNFAHDVEQDLNAPRPIVAGGTGATNAHDALIALHGEEATQVVTNYNTFPFVAGSFVSAPGTTGEPVAGATAIGICYVFDASSMFLEARILNDGVVQPGRMFVRQKFAGSWSPEGWIPDNQVVLDSKVSKTGDTMTGNLAITKVDPALVLGGTASGQTRQVVGTTGASAFGVRWAIRLGTPTAESGGNLGSDFDITRYTDAGAVIDQPLSIARNSGLVLVNTLQVNGGALVAGALTANNNIASVVSATTGLYAFGSSGTKYLNYNGTNFGFNGGGLTVLAGTTTLNALTVNADTLWAGAASATPGIGNTTTGGALGSGGYIALSRASGSAMHLNTNADGTLQLHQRSGVAVGSISVTASSTAYNTSSSAELKEDLKSFDAGRIVDDTEVYNFAWKQSAEQIAAGEPADRAYGVVAQEAVEVYPEAVTHDEARDWWGVDYSKYVPVLLQELKALRARVAQLEAGTASKPA